MHATLLSVFVTLLSIVGLVSTSPVRRDLGGILMCTGANATGTCEHKVFPLKTCVNVTAPFINSTKTFAPDGERFACFPYAYACGGECRSPEGCTLGAVGFGYAHKYNLSSVSWERMKSFECYSQAQLTDEAR